MEGADSSSPRVETVTSTAAARVLLRPEERRFLEPFVGRELGAAQAARELELSVETLAYRVRALSRAGLLRQTGEVPRKGRPVKLYRAAEEIRAPLALLPYEDVAGFFGLVDAGSREAFLSALARLADRSGLGNWVVRMYRAAEGGIRLDLAPADGSWDPDVLLSDRAPAVVFNWVPLALEPARAKDLQRELLDLLGRYTDPNASRHTHLMGLFLTPLPRD